MATRGDGEAGQPAPRLPFFLKIMFCDGPAAPCLQSNWRLSLLTEQCKRNECDLGILIVSGGERRGRQQGGDERRDERQ